jgi:DNA-binding GntR family transcriptional regulator
MLPGMPRTQQPGGEKTPSGVDIADWIRNQIRSRRFVPGQRLVEFDITRRTGASRFKVREALQRLAAEGLVEIEEYRGASVRSASMDEVRQLYVARGALEGICAADFTRRSSPAQRAQLQEIAEAMERAVEQDTPELFGRLNAQWHGLIMEGSGNHTIRSVVQRLNTPIHHLLFETFYRADRLRSATADHKAILEAIMNNDPEGARAAMSTHIDNGLRFLSRLDSALHFD